MTACCLPLGLGCSDQFTEGECLFQGGTFNPFFGCEFFDCDQHLPKGACCHLDDSCTIGTIFDCFDTEGEFQGDAVSCEESDCAPPPPTLGCIRARKNTRDGRRMPWSVNLCQNAYFLPFVDPETGDWSLLSSHPIRAMEADPASSVDPCAHHRADVALDGEGFAVGCFCSQPVWNDEDTRQLAFADLYVMADPEPQDRRKPKRSELDPFIQIEPGDAYFVAAYHAPWWTEAHLSSHKVRCELPV